VRRQFNFLELSVTANDDEVSGRDQVSRSAIDADHAASRRARDGVCREPATIVDVVNLDLFVLENVGRPHQVRINRHASFVMELRIGHSCAMNFGFQQNSLHGAEILFKSSGFSQVVPSREILAKHSQFRASAIGVNRNPAVTFRFCAILCREPSRTRLKLQNSDEIEDH